MNLEFHPEAAVYYEFQVPGLGERCGAGVRRAADLLLQYPELALRVDLELRQLALGRFPFTLIYCVSPDALQIVAIAHQKRRPGYWRTRVRR